MSRPDQSATGGPEISCYSCGQRQPRSHECVRCRAGFARICACGAVVGMYDGKCAACGREVLHRVVKKGMFRVVRKLPWRWISRVGILAFAGGAAFLVARSQHWIGGSGGSAGDVWRLRDEATKSFESRAYADAEKGFRSLTERSPRDADAWYMLSLTERELKLSKEVWTATARKAMEANPRHARAATLLGSASLDDGAFAQAATYAQTALSVAPDYALAWCVLGETLYRRTPPDLPGAERAFSRARAAGDETVRTALRLVELRQRLGPATGLGAGTAQLEEAVRNAEALLRGDAAKELPAAERQVVLAELSVARGDLRAASEMATTALSQLPSEAPSQLRARLHLVRVRADATSDPVSAANDAFEAVRLLPEHDVAASAASALASVGRREDAIAALERAAAVGDPRGDVRLVLADALLATGATSRARDVLAAAVAAGASGLQPALLQGAIALSEKRFAEARRTFDECVLSWPDRPEPILGLVATVLGDEAGGQDRTQAIETAVKIVEAARPRLTDSPQVLVAEARLHMALGHRDLAKPLLERATQDAPSFADGWMLLGEILLRQGGPDAPSQAAIAFRNARQLRPNDVTLATLEAETLLMGGDPSGAISVCSQILRERAGDATARRLRARASRVAGLWPSAASDLQVLRDNGDQDDDSTAQLVEALYMARRTEEARQLIASVRPTASKRLGALLEAARAIHEGNGIEEAERALGGAEGKTVAAAAMLATGRVAGAAEAARAALALAPGHPEATRLFVLSILEVQPLPPDAVEASYRAIAALRGDAPRGLSDFLNGRTLLAEKKFAQAKEPLLAAASNLITDPFVLICLGVARIETGERDLGLQTLRAALAAPLVPGAARAVIARQFLAAGTKSADARERRALVFEALRLDPTDVTVSLAAADEHARRGEYSAAWDVLERAIAVPREFSDAERTRLRLGAASMRLAGGDAEAALRHVRALPESERSGPTALAMQGYALLRSGDFGEAERAFAAALGKDPGNEFATLGAAASRVTRGDDAGAITIAVGWLNRDGDARVPIAVVRMLANRERFEPAVDLARRLCAAKPAVVAAHQELCNVLAAAGRLDEAMSAAREAERTATADTRVSARLMLAGASNSWGGDAAGALTASRSVLAEPNASPEERTEARVLEAECLAALGRDTEAQTAMTALRSAWVDGEPELPVDRAYERRLRFVGGLLAAKAGNHALAVQEFRVCVEKAPLDRSALNNLAWCLAQGGGDPAEAVLQARKLTTSQPQIPNWWDTRGAAALVANDLADAEMSWRKALEGYGKAGDGARADYAATAVRLAKLLRKLDRKKEAAELAREATERVRSGPVADEARKILSDSP